MLGFGAVSEFAVSEIPVVVVVVVEVTPPASDGGGPPPGGSRKRRILSPEETAVLEAIRPKPAGPVVKALAKQIARRAPKTAVVIIPEAALDDEQEIISLIAALLSVLD